MFYSFIWNNTDRIKRNTLIAEIADGGINMIDIDSHILALKASRISKIIDTNDSWAALGKDYLNILPNFNIVRLTFNKVDTFPLVETLPTFYQDVILGFNKSKVCPKPHNKLLSQVIWGNRHFTYWDKYKKTQSTLYFKEWLAAGLTGLMT